MKYYYYIRADYNRINAKFILGQIYKLVVLHLLLIYPPVCQIILSFKTKQFFFFRNQNRKSEPWIHFGKS